MSRSPDIRLKTRNGLAAFFRPAFFGLPDGVEFDKRLLSSPPARVV
jgi:hypothetical protein